MPKKTILVTGGAGFIGSQVNLMLHDAGFDTIVLDNLSSGNEKAVVCGKLVVGDLADKKLLDNLFSSSSIEAVMHFAASIDVGQSVKDPALYYSNNVVNSLKLLDAMRKANVKNLIFSSSAAVYGVPHQESLTESSPCSPINPYGETKLILEKVLRDYVTAYGFHASSLRYFNAAGGDPSGRLKYWSKTQHNLIPIVLEAIMNKGTVTINGNDYSTRDGTCIRDYIHVADLGDAHILALQKLLKGNVSPCYNLGNGQGFSVREVIAAAEEVTGQKLKIHEGQRRPGDPPILLANAEKAHKELNWSPRYPKINTMIEHAWYARQK